MIKTYLFENCEDNPLDVIFKYRKEEIESYDQEDKKFIQENEIFKVTEESLIESINKLENIADETKKEIIRKFVTFAENREELEAYMERKYYRRGAMDIINIICGK